MEETASEFGQRRRSNSVPILSQIERVLDRRGSAVLEREANKDSYDDLRSLPKTPLPRNLTQPRARLSSGGLIRNHKKKLYKAAMERTRSLQQSTGSEDVEDDQSTRPKAFTVSEVYSSNQIDYSPSKEFHQTNPVIRSTGLAQARTSSFTDIASNIDCDHFALRGHVDRARSKSLPCDVDNCNSDTSRGHEIIYGAKDGKHKRSTFNKYGSEDKFYGSLSPPACLQDDSIGKQSKLNIAGGRSHLDLEGSSVYCKPITAQMTRNARETADYFPNSNYRRRSLPCYLGNHHVLRGTLQSEDVLAMDSKDELDRGEPWYTMGIKTRRSMSLPLATSFVDESVKDVYSEEKSRDFIHGLRLDYHSKQRNESDPSFSDQSNCSRKIFSKSLPSLLNVNDSKQFVKGLADVSSSSTRHKSLIDKARHRRANSLPVPTTEESQGIASTPEVTGHLKKENPDKNKRVEQCERNEENRHQNNSQHTKQKAQLGRARSFPLSLQGGSQKRITRQEITEIQKELNVAIDNFFKRDEVEERKRSKSLPNVLQGIEDVSFMPAEKPVPSERNIPEIVIADANNYDTENNRKRDDETKLTNEEGGSHATLSCHDTLQELAIEPNSNSILPDKPIASVVRPRGFSMPSSFKMEKIPEESSECDKSEVMDAKLPVECFNAPNRSLHLDEINSAYVSSRHEDDDYQRRLSAFDDIVTKVLAGVVRLDFSKSSSCLHRAVAIGDLESTRTLVEAGSDVNAVDESGWPPLHAAVITGNLNCGAWLVDAGADLIEYTNFVIDEFRTLSRDRLICFDY